MTDWISINKTKPLRKMINELQHFHSVNGGIRFASIINFCFETPNWTNLCNLEHLLSRVTNAFCIDDDQKFPI